MKQRGHETLDHTADMGLRGWGASMGEAFEEIASAMFELIIDGQGIEPTRNVTVRCDGSDPQELLIELLNELLLRSDLEEVIFLDLAIDRIRETDGGYSVDATAHGVPLGDARGRLFIEVKAATYCGSGVRREKDGSWVASCVVDL